MPYKSSGAGGDIRISCTWRDADGGTDTTTTTVAIAASTETYAAIRAGAGEAWEDLVSRISERIYPDGFITDRVINRQWSHPPVTVEFTIEARGGTRVVDACLFEEPVGITMEADDDGTDWCSHMWKLGNPSGISVGTTGSYLRYPLQRKSETTPDGDPRGLWHQLDVAEAHATHLGPLLFEWHAYRETDAEPDFAELFFTTASNTYVSIDESGRTTYDATAPGWSLSSGGYARNRSDADDLLVLRDRIASIPVIVRAYAYIDAVAGEEGTLLMQSHRFSSVPLTIDQTSAAWHTTSGHLRCGITPEQESVCQGFLKTESAVDCHLGAVRVYAARGVVDA